MLAPGGSRADDAGITACDPQQKSGTWPRHADRISLVNRRRVAVGIARSPLSAGDVFRTKGNTQSRSHSKHNHPRRRGDRARSRLAIARSWRQGMPFDPGVSRILGSDRRPYARSNEYSSAHNHFLPRPSQGAAAIAYGSSTGLICAESQLSSFGGNPVGVPCRCLHTPSSAKAGNRSGAASCCPRSFLLRWAFGSP